VGQGGLRKTHGLGDGVHNDGGGVGLLEVHDLGDYVHGDGGGRGLRNVRGVVGAYAKYMTFLVTACTVIARAMAPGVRSSLQADWWLPSPESCSFSTRW
jgi:hypothetical protein